MMNDDERRRNSRGWNDPPMYTIEQMNKKPTSTVPLNKRYKYAMADQQMLNNQMYQQTGNYMQQNAYGQATGYEGAAPNKLANQYSPPPAYAPNPAMIAPHSQRILNVYPGTETLSGQQPLAMANQFAYQSTPTSAYPPNQINPAITTSINQQSIHQTNPTLEQNANPQMSVSNSMMQFAYRNPIQANLPMIVNLPMIANLPVIVNLPMIANLPMIGSHNQQILNVHPVTQTQSGQQQSFDVQQQHQQYSPPPAYAPNPAMIAPHNQRILNVYPGTETLSGQQPLPMTNQSAYQSTQTSAYPPNRINPAITTSINQQSAYGYDRLQQSPCGQQQMKSQVEKMKEDMVKQKNISEEIFQTDYIDFDEMMIKKLNFNKFEPIFKPSEEYLNTVYDRILFLSRDCPTNKLDHVLVVFEETLAAIHHRLDPQKNLKFAFNLKACYKGSKCEEECITLQMRSLVSYCYMSVMIFGEKEASDLIQQLCLHLNGMTLQNKREGFLFKAHGIATNGDDWYLVTYDEIKDVEFEMDKFEIKFLGKSIVTQMKENKKKWTEECLNFYESIHSMFIDSLNTAEQFFSSRSYDEKKAQNDLIYAWNWFEHYPVKTNFDIGLSKRHRSIKFKRDFSLKTLRITTDEKTISYDLDTHRLFGERFAMDKWSFSKIGFTLNIKQPALDYSDLFKNCDIFLKKICNLEVWAFARLRSAIWIVEKITSAVNASLNRKDDIFQMIDQSRCKLFPKTKRDEIFLNFLVLREPEPIYVLILAAIQVVFQSEIRRKIKQICAYLKLAFVENKKRGISMTTYALIRNDRSLWYLMTYDGIKEVEFEDDRFSLYFIGHYVYGPHVLSFIPTVYSIMLKYAVQSMENSMC